MTLQYLADADVDNLLKMTNNFMMKLKSPFTGEFLMNSSNQMNLFDNESDTAMYKHKLTLEKIRGRANQFWFDQKPGKGVHLSWKVWIEDCF